jgi:hypothetical protein
MFVQPFVAAIAVGHDDALLDIAGNMTGKRCVKKPFRACNAQASGEVPGARRARLCRDGSCNVDDRRASAYVFDEVVFEEIGVDQLGRGWKFSRRGVACDATDVVPARDQTGDEGAAEHAGGADHEDGHVEARASTRVTSSAFIACRT